MRISDWSSDVCPSDLLVTIPTLQNPTTITLDAARRAEIIEVARAHDLMIVEDDAYCVFADAGAADCFADLAPERTLMVAGVSKAVAPGLRSEEHTPELQSLMRISYAVFCLKKKN